MNLGPIAGLLGAALASLSVFKWILAGFIGIMILWIMSQGRNVKNALDARALKDLIKSASQWNVRAIQDSNPMIALMNSNYAMAYFNVARSIGSDADIEKHTQIQIDQFLQELEATQQACMQSITKTCPAIGLSGHTASFTGWAKPGDSKKMNKGL
jgi:hypothetical protein